MAEQYLPEETTIDIKELVRIFQKRRNLILAVFLGSVIIATVISFLIPKTYEAETTLRIKQSKGLANSLLADLPMGNTMATKQLMSTYAEILKSRTVVEKVISLTQAGQEKPLLYEEMLARISTLPIRDTELLKLTVQAKSPTEAQLIANTLVEVFIERMTNLVRSEQSMVRRFIGERLIEAKDDLDRSETALEAYKRNQQIIAPEEETRAIVEQLSTMNKLAAENHVELASAQARLENARLQIEKEKPEFIAENTIIQQYKSKLADLEVQLVSILQKYTDKHPDVISLRAAIAETKQRLNTEIARVINNEAPSMNPVHQGLLQSKIQSEAEIAAAKAQKDAINKIMTSKERDITTLPAKEQGLVRVSRDAMLAQEIYLMLAKRHEEARISEVMQPTDVQIIDTAIAPPADRPVKPNKKLNVMIAAFLGLFAGTGLAFILEYFNKTITSTDDVKNYLDLPVLGRIPEFENPERERGARRTS